MPKRNERENLVFWDEMTQKRGSRAKGAHKFAFLSQKQVRERNERENFAFVHCFEVKYANVARFALEFERKSQRFTPPTSFFLKPYSPTPLIPTGSWSNAIPKVGSSTTHHRHPIVGVEG